jgi:proliferating cell nuclear antigen
MVFIRDYKGFEINYDAEDKMFFAKKADEKFSLSTSQESQLIDSIDDSVKIIERAKEAEEQHFKKEKELLEKETVIPKDLKITFANDYFTKNVSVISEFINECRLDFNEKELSIIATDSANVAMVIFKLSSASAVEWKISKSFSVGINVSHLYSILNKLSKNDMLKISYLDAENLLFTLIGEIKREYKLRIIEICEQENKVPELKFPVTALIQTHIFARILKEANAVAESVKFTSKGKKLIFTCDNDDSKEKYKAIIEEDDENKICTEADVSNKYSIEYLQKMIKPTKMQGETTISFSKDYPLRIDNSRINVYKLSFILAPRVEND